MKKLLSISVVLLLMMFLSSCNNKQSAKPDNKSGSEVAKEDVLSKTDGSGNRGLDADKDKNANKAGTSSPFTDIYFDYNKSNIKSDAKATLKSVADYMTANPNATISAEGHCDERGTAEYNLALGDRRAKAVKDSLKSLGVPKAKISTFSYGKENPVCPEQEESCWSKNRRVHFVVTKNAGK
ncbi:MAG: peptidoglycan-associated lipoprotein Pal [Nitrospirae bacterium]|nr:peptidoglycan-associated lipoprotein Pal [Nitrospirota bacterium]